MFRGTARESSQILSADVALAGQFVQTGAVMDTVTEVITGTSGRRRTDEVSQDAKSRRDCVAFITAHGESTSPVSLATALRYGGGELADTERCPAAARR